jgi:hypothetical protein
MHDRFALEVCKHSADTVLPHSDSFSPVLRILIHMFLDLPDPNPDTLVRYMDMDLDPAPDRDPSISFRSGMVKLVFSSVEEIN